MNSANVLKSLGVVVLFLINALRHCMTNKGSFSTHAL